MKLRSLIVSLASGALIATGLIVPPAHAVDPVVRVSCPAVAAVNKALGTTTLTHLTSRLDACSYASQPIAHSTDAQLIMVLDRGTPADTQRAIEDGWPNDYPYSFSPVPVPELGAGAFWWADASPMMAHWQVSPGLVGLLTGGLLTPQNLAATARLFRPMMEVYTVPGEHTVNGRRWRTTCEDYSQTERCRTEIWATVITVVGGRYLRTDGWAFNSLTYRWSDRTLWKTNPLGDTGSWTSTDGRQWKTECDNAASGRGACRSYRMTTVVGWTGSAYKQENKWVLNNQVLFT
ncbi:hypothetical protein [Tessaracoccus flavus]|uniref:Uncharacterized protein n=1 Tax=Tessaracoccus flavus TaxID=1610493 RepID=A0A1Q2CGI4_9ACTN|nr:hypothetical protein [Tessaracoccus flavus]AQP45170.1 hypothetical protein RPIT_10490 [Tessaracoccus flavus]SDY54356.1 hypothetical protein SAMN05428934_102207 [Tessaracoccus flavus]